MALLQLPWAPFDRNRQTVFLVGFKKNTIFSLKRSYFFFNIYTFFVLLSIYSKKTYEVGLHHSKVGEEGGIYHFLNANKLGTKKS